MALELDRDFNTGTELKGMYFRIDKINFNDTDFQVIATGYASEKAYRDGKLPVIDPRAYTQNNYDRKLLASMNVFEYAYLSLKTAEEFNEARDIFEDGQEPPQVLDIN